MVEFVMPILGADMVQGTLVAWRKKPGDRIRRGEIIAEVETDKGLIDVEVFVTGVIAELLVAPGATVPTGTALALITEEEPAPVRVGMAAPAAVQPVPSTAAPTPRAPAPSGPAAPGRLRISPLARKVAETLGVDVETVMGTGLGGSITREDVERAAAARRVMTEGSSDTRPLRDRVSTRTEPVLAAPPGMTVEPEVAARMRRTIGAAMARSKREIPHYYLATTVEIHRAMTWLADENTRRPIPERLLPVALLVKAVALALREVPELNARWVGDRVVPSEAIHVGVAISLRQGGLVAPALHDADRKSLGELMHAFRDLVQRARTGGLRSSELSDPTITVTSLGDRGVEDVFAIIYPPQVAIVGFGRIVERPWVVSGQVLPRSVVRATLSGDHRVTDGHRGGLFLAAVDHRLQEPDRL